MALSRSWRASAAVRGCSSQRASSGWRLPSRVVLRPGLALVLLTLIVAAWAIFTGIIELGAAVALRRIIKGEWLLAAAGALSIVFGGMVAIFPSAGLLAIVWIIGAYAIIWGLLFLVLALRMRGMRAVIVVST